MHPAPIEVVVIPREQAVFRLDARGRWCNHHGVFRNRRISDHFHACIRRDAGGYHLRQEFADRVEKVYFPYDDTALFVVEVALRESVGLTLNTRRRVDLDPGLLFVRGESLYITLEGERVKFTERAMLTLSEVMEFTPEGYAIRTAGRVHRIREVPNEATGCDA
jgi:hypothetical protein